MKNLAANSAYHTLTGSKKRSGTAHGSRVRDKSKKSKGIPAWDNSHTVVPVKPSTAGSPSRNK